MAIQIICRSRIHRRAKTVPHEMNRLRVTAPQHRLQQLPQQHAFARNVFLRRQRPLRGVTPIPRHDVRNIGRHALRQHCGGDGGWPAFDPGIGHFVTERLRNPAVRQHNRHLGRRRSVRRHDVHERSSAEHLQMLAQRPDGWKHESRWLTIHRCLVRRGGQRGQQKILRRCSRVECEHARRLRVTGRARREGIHSRAQQLSASAVKTVCRRA